VISFKFYKFFSALIKYQVPQIRVTYFYTFEEANKQNLFLSFLKWKILGVQIVMSLHYTTFLCTVQKVQVSLIGVASTTLQ